MTALDGIFGLSPTTVAKINGVLAQHACVERAIIYGSRAKGTYRTGSDIDLVLEGDGLELRELQTIEHELDELLLPYTIDISIFDHIKHLDLREHIARVGKVFYPHGKAE